MSNFTSEAIVGNNINTLKIHFGGLCMFVQRAPKLHVLMPDMTMDTEPHHPIMIVSMSNLESCREVAPSESKYVLYPLCGQGSDVLPDLPPKEAVELPWALNVSEYNGAPVDDSYITDRPAGKLAARLSFPLGYDLQGESKEPGSIVVDGFDTPVPVHSAACLTFTDLDRRTIRVGKADLTLPKQGKGDGSDTVEIYVYNVRLGEIPVSDDDASGDMPQRTHWKGQEIHHPMAYYDLLKPGGETPKFTVAKAGIPGADRLVPDVQCPHRPVVFDFVKPVRHFVDTHDCSLGQGS